MAVINKNKYLVTCVEASGFTRGQATATRDDAMRMFDHFRNCEPMPLYVEVRRLGGLTASFEQREDEPPLLRTNIDGRG